MVNSQSRSNESEGGKAHSGVQKAVPMGSTFQDLFAGGGSVWLKILGGAVCVPLVVFGALRRGNRRGGVGLPEDPTMLALILGLAAAVGAVLGALLSLKDVVQARLADNQPVAFPFRLMFGMGIRSLLVVWVPVAIVLTIIGTMISIM